jgi:DNA-binding NtrC family response regulator
MIETLTNADLVLIIDDDETVLNVTQQIVMRCGFATAVASSGLEGLATLEQRGDEIKCILLDMSMPHMDGASTFEAIEKVSPTIPVIIVSGYPSDDLKSRFGACQPHGFIQKPFSITDLDLRLREAVSSTQGSAKVGRYAGPLASASSLASASRD